MAENGGKWTTSQRRFQQWLAVPRVERSPPTMELFAKSIGVSDRTLTRWRKLDGFQDAVNNLARSYLQSDLPDIYGALRREAGKGSYHHIKLALELVGDYVERSENKNINEDTIYIFEGIEVLPDNLASGPAKDSPAEE